LTSSHKAFKPVAREINDLIAALYFTALSVYQTAINEDDTRFKKKNEYDNSLPIPIKNYEIRFGMRTECL
jgi:hypothetical protein